MAALREAHGGRLELGGPAEVPGVAKAERFVQPTIVVDPKKVPRLGGKWFTHPATNHRKMVIFLPVDLPIP